MLSAEQLARFRAGDPDAVRAVYREYGRLVYVVALRQLGSDQLAQEAAQLTFTKAWRAAASIEPGRDLAPWLATIARRTAIDLHRREVSQRAVPLADLPASDPALATEDEPIETTWTGWQVRRAVDELPADEREIVRLQHLEGLSQSAVSDRLGIPVGTVKSRSHRAHRRLAARLGYLREPDG